MIGKGPRCHYTPQQNGVVNRNNRHLLDIVRTLLLESSLPFVNNQNFPKEWHLHKLDMRMTLTQMGNNGT